MDGWTRQRQSEWEPSQLSTAQRYSYCYILAVVRNAHDTVTRNQRQKNGTRKPVLVSGASDMHFTELFWYQFLVKNKACSIFVSVYSTIFWYGFSAPIPVRMSWV